MKTRNKRIAGLAAAGVLVGGGLAGAFAATSGQDDQANDLASALSKQTGEQVTASDVTAAFKDVLAQRLKDDVAAGRMTQAQADEMLKRAANAPLPGMGGGHGERGGHHGGRMGMHEVQAAVAGKLGMTADQLHTARESGKTLAQVAESKGVSRADLIATITTAITAGDRGADLTDAQAKEMATHMVDDAHEGRGGHGDPGGPGGGAVEDAITKALGITEDAWHTAREAGKSPAEVAKDKGVDRAELVTAVTAALKKQGPPPGGTAATDAQVKQMATDIVDGKGGPGNHGGGHHMPPQGP